MEKISLFTEPIVRLIRPRTLLALLTTSTTCKVHERSCEIVMPSFDFGSIFTHLFQGALSELLYCKIKIQNSLKCAFLIDEQRRKQFVGHFVLKNAVLQPPLANFQTRQTMCYTLFVRFSNMATNQATVNPHVPVTQIEGLGSHVVNITRYVIRIKKQLHNRIEIIEIESNRKECESLHHY